MAAVSGMGSNRQSREEVHAHSGWLVLLAFWLITAALFALFLLYYFVPSPAALIQRQPAPTDQLRPVHVQLGGQNFVIPANYMIFPGEREGGVRHQLVLFALSPDFRGYSRGQAQQFASGTAQSRVVHMRLRADGLDLSEGARLRRVFMSYVVSQHGLPTAFGLTLYTFREDNGYRGQDLFVGHVDGHPVVMRCWRFADNSPAPDCTRDLRLGRDVVMSYRFKRAHLGQWRQIAGGVQRLIDSFEQHGR